MTDKDHVELALRRTITKIEGIYVYHEIHRAFQIFAVELAKASAEPVHQTDPAGEGEIFVKLPIEHPALAALTSAAVMFHKYAADHQRKAEEIEYGPERNQRAEKAARNRRIAETLEAVVRDWCCG